MPAIFFFFFFFCFLNLEIFVQQVNLLLRRTGGLGPPFYYKSDEYEG